MMHLSSNRVVFHLSASEGGVETWLSDFLNFGGGTYLIHSTSPTVSRSIGAGAVTKRQIFRFVYRFLKEFRERFRVRKHPREKVFLVFNIQSAIYLLILLPRARFLYFSCNNFGVQLPMMKPLRRLIFPQIEGFILRRADFVFSLSPSDSRRIALVRPDVETIRSSYNDRVFHQRYLSEGRRNGVLWIGRLVDLKDPHLALSAFEASADSHRESFTIVGEGPLASQIRRRVASSRYQGRIHLSPRIGTEDLASKVRSARLVLITSTTEAAPRTVLECLASGTPVVSTGAGDPENWIFRTQGGWLSLDRSPSALAALILENLTRNHPVNGDLVEAARASRVMPEVEQRISQIIDSLEW